MMPSSKYEQKFGQNHSQFPKYPSYQKNSNEFAKYMPSSVPVSVNSSINSVANGCMSATGASWKPKVGSPQSTILSASEIKDKVLQFRSPKYLNSNKSAGMSKTSGIVQE